jgi:hypothetical protein
MPSLPGDRQRPDPVERFGAASVFLPMSGTPDHEPSRSHRSKRSRTTDSSDIDELLAASFSVATRSYAELISSRTVLLPTGCFFPLIVPPLRCTWLGGRVFGQITEEVPHIVVRNRPRKLEWRDAAVIPSIWIGPMGTQESD